MARLFEDLLMRREQVGDGELGRYFTPPTIDERETARVDSRSLGFHVHHLRRQLARRSASVEPPLEELQRVSRRDGDER
jgi:hypothetical protein